MNRVGEEGKGESVWLGWFLLKTLGNFIGIAKAHGDAKRAKAWDKHANTLKQALENAAWDGEWYRRGSYDDGTPLGSRNSDECKIDRSRSRGASCRAAAIRCGRVPRWRRRPGSW